MTRISFEVPATMAATAIHEIEELAHVRGLTVLSAEGETTYRESDSYCPCGRRLREERRGPAGSWVRYCVRCGDSGDAA